MRAEQAEFDVSFRQHYSNRWDVKQVPPRVGSLGVACWVPFNLAGS